MGTMREHLRESHLQTAEHELAASKFHKACSAAYSRLAEMHKAEESEGPADAFGTLSAQHSAMAAKCADHAQFHTDCAKTLMEKTEGDDLGKRGDAIVRDGVHAIYPNLRAVQRPGGPPIPAAPGSDIIDKALSGIDID